MAINSVILVGNVTADPRKGKAGETPFIEFSIAVNEFKGGEEVANFFDCTIYGKRAVALADLVKKGQRVAVSGRLRQDRWKTEDDKTRTKVSIVVNDLEFMSAKAADNEPLPW